MTFGLTLWELLCGKRAVIQTSDHDDVLDVCSGHVVVIDAANQAQFGHSGLGVGARDVDPSNLERDKRKRVRADPVWVDAGGKGGKQHDKRWAVSLRREGKH